MAAESRLDSESRPPRRPAIWPWLLMPLIVLAVFFALLRVHHRPGTPWATGWMHPTSEDRGAPSQQP